MKLLFLCLLTLLFLGCSCASLRYSPERLYLESNTTSHVFIGQTLKKKQKKLSQISIEQNIFEDEYKQLLVYEYARLSSGYRFKSSFTYILNHVFNAKKVTLEHNEKGLGFFIISLRSDETIYVLVNTATKKSLSMIYGLSEENFFALLNGKPLRPQKNEQNTSPIKSAWNEKLIITAVLLRKEGGRKFQKR